MTTKDKVLSVLGDGKPKATREVIMLTGLKDKAVDSALRRCWKEELLLRTDKPISKHTKTFKGRAGIRLNMRHFYLYMKRLEDVDRLNYHGRVFVKFEEQYLDKRGKKGRKSKASMIIDFLKENSDRAFYSTDIYEKLKDQGIKMSDVSGNRGRFEKRGVNLLARLQNWTEGNPV